MEKNITIEKKIIITIVFSFLFHIVFEIVISLLRPDYYIALYLIFLALSFFITIFYTEKFIFLLFFVTGNIQNYNYDWFIKFEGFTPNPFLFTPFVLIGFLYICKYKTIRSKFTSVEKLCLIFFAYIVLAGVFHQNLFQSIKYIIMVTLVFIVIKNMMLKSSAINGGMQKIVDILLVSTTMIAFNSFFVSLNIINIEQINQSAYLEFGNRMVGFWGAINPNALSNILVIGIVIITQKFILSKIHRNKFSIVMYLAAIIHIYCLIKSHTRGPILALILSIIVLFYFYYGKRVIFWSVPLLFLSYAFYSSIIYYFARGDIASVATLESRTYIWEFVFEKLRNNLSALFFGYGVGIGFDRLNLNESYRHTHTHAHNGFLQMIVETGIIGFFIFTFLLKKIFEKLTINKKVINHFKEQKVLFFSLLISISICNMTGNFFPMEHNSILVLIVTIIAFVSVAQTKGVSRGIT